MWPCVYMSLSNIKVNNSTVIEVDEQPTAESDNLVKSGGVYNHTSTIHGYDIENSDLEFSDENNNCIVEFKNGHIKTKNFDSSDIPSTDIGIDIDDIEKSDLEFSDENSNCIVTFKDGHIKTKNFDSANIPSISDTENYKNIFKLNKYTLDGVDSEWNLTRGQYISNGTLFGWSNKLVIKKENTINDKVWIFDFSADGNGIYYFGSCGSVYGTTGGKQSLFSVNFSNNTINIHNYVENPFVSIPQIAESKTVSLSTDKKYRVVLSRKDRVMHLTLLDITTNLILVDSIEKDFGISSSYGLMYDMPCCFSENYSMKLYNVEINIPSKNLPTLIIEGDSITAAWVTPESQGYGELIASECKGLCVKISGRGNGGIRNLIESQTPIVGRLAAEVYPIKPDYTMVTIGTNDYGIVSNGTFKTFLEYLVDYICTEVKSVLILNHIPMNERTGGASVINDIIDEVISEKSQYNIRCIRFDVCTAINYDPSQGIDTSLFADAAHPNKLGYERMFEQAKIDVPELFYNTYK